MNLFEETIAENFSNLGKETDIQIQEAQRTPNKINKSRSTQRHIVIKLAKHKKKKKIKNSKRKEDGNTQGKLHKAIRGFLSQHPSVTLVIYVSRLFWHLDQQNRQGLRDLVNSGVTVQIMRVPGKNNKQRTLSVDARLCW